MKIQMDLTPEENEIIGLVKVMQKFKSKVESIRYIIKIYGEQKK